jgi:hypothetical protein
MDQQADRIERRLNIDFVMSVRAADQCGRLRDRVLSTTHASLMMSAQTWP